MLASGDNVIQVATSELQKLQTAIKYGDVEKAKQFACFLAQQRASLRIEADLEEEEKHTDGLIRLRIQIETKDKSGAFLDWKVTSDMTINDLSEKLQAEQGFPVEVQTWIMGNRICRGAESLSSCGINKSGHSIYMYMISASKVSLTRANFDRRNNDQPDAARLPTAEPVLDEQMNELRLDYDEPVAHRATIHAPFDTEDMLPSISQVGWECIQCTYINEPTRPGCEVCFKDRPENYVVPGIRYKMSKEERIRLEKEKLQERQLKEQEDHEREERESEKMINFLQLLQYADQDTVRNTEEFTCTVCYLDVAPGDGIILKECLHPFCMECLRGLIQACEEPVVKCPHQDNEYSCPAVLLDAEIKQIVSEEEYFRHLSRSLNMAENASANSFHCKTTDCVGWCFYDDDVNFFTCPVCAKKNCLTCKAIHPDQDCKEFQDDLAIKAQNDQDAKKTQQALQKMLSDGDAMECPQCKIIITKKLGCDWLRCSMCKTEICWITKGHRWGPKGAGDTSAGCRCGVNGRCHPQCGNCH